MSQKEEYEMDFILDFKIENIVATAPVEIEDKIALKQIAQKHAEVEYNPERFPGLIMRIEKPRATILVFSTGKMVITGLRKAIEAEVVVEKVMKRIKKAGVSISKPIITIQNVVASGDLHELVDLNLAAITLDSAMYEPEVFPGLIYRMQDPKTVFLIFSTGRIVCTGAKDKVVVKEVVIKLNKEIRELGITQNKFKDSDFQDISFI